MAATVAGTGNKGIGGVGEEDDWFVFGYGPDAHLLSRIIFPATPR